jgi:ATP/maltotriose-dependent transcriptional regulator MalT
MAYVESGPEGRNLRWDVARGELAEMLVISPGTIKSHLHHVYEKLGVSDRSAAVARALRAGLIE